MDIHMKNVVFMLAGTASLIGATCLYVHEKTFLTQARPASGTVMEIVELRSKGAPRDSVARRPRVEFMTEQGSTVSFVPDWGIWSGSSVGKKYDVLYLPHDPATAQIKGGFSQWGAVGIFVLIGLVLPMIAVRDWIVRKTN